MISARRYHPTNSGLFTWLVRHSYCVWLKNAYNAKAIGLDLFKTLKPPFILVGNHCTLLDPFLTNTFIPNPIHWVASDGNMRSPLMRFLLIKLVGSIPKSKAIPDIETVNWIVEIIRKQKGVVGFYPEGQSTWNGRTLPAFGSTAKLIKLLKVPVVCALSRGAYMTKPRWAYTVRRGEMEIEFSTLFTPREIKELSVGEIDGRLNAAIAHDDTAWARGRGLAFPHKNRAESLELALYACPSCGKLHSLESREALVSCASCGFAAEYGEDGSFRVARKGDSEKPEYAAQKDGKPGVFFASLREWDLWQEAWLEKLLRTKYAADPELPIFSDKKVSLLKGKRMDTMKNLGSGSLLLNSKALVFRPERGKEVVFSRKDIEGPGVLKWNFLEFYVGKTVYRVTFASKSSSGRKYAVALELLSRLDA